MSGWYAPPELRRTELGQRQYARGPNLIVILEIEEPPRAVIVADNEQDTDRVVAHVDSLLERRPGAIEEMLRRWLAELERAT